MSESAATEAEVEVAPSPEPEPRTEQDAIDALDNALMEVTEDVVYDLQGNPLPTVKEVETSEAAEPEADESESEEPRKVDYDQVVPMDNVLGEDQEPLTIGQMKDEVTTLRRGAAKVEKMEFELMRERQIVNEILSSDGPVSADKKQQIEDMRKQYADKQKETIYQQFPEWRDPLVMQKVIPELQQVARSAGFSNPEIQELAHPAIFNLMERVRRYEAREKKALIAVKTAQQTPRKEAGRTAPAKKTGGKVSIDSILSRNYKSETEVPWGDIDKLLG